MTETTQPDRRVAGRAVRARRGVLGFTQIQAAERAGVDVKTLRDLETGKRWPIASNLAAIGAALGFGPGELQAIADEPERVAS